MNKYSENYLNYQQSQCAKPIHQPDAQALYSFSNISLNNTFSQTGNFMDIPQNAGITHHNSVYFPISTYQEQMDMLNWENRLLPELENSVKTTDKMETIEITTKDLSPVSYCNNMDLIVTDCYKSNTTSHSKYNSQWYNQGNWNQRFNFPSCAHEKSSRYNNTLKNLDVDSTIKKYPFISDILPDTSEIKSRNHKNTSNNLQDYSAYSNLNNYYHSKSENQQMIQSNCINATTLLQNDPVIDQQTDCSNDESDIIVEESDEEITDYSEDQEKRTSSQSNRCLICNVVYTPLGTQFYYITTQNPLTMSSQKPVYSKIVTILGKLSKTNNYICRECLGLINTIDHLQFKLETFYEELKMKFKKTCIANGNRYKQINNKKPKVYIKFPKYKCKICKKIVCFRKYCYYHIKKHRNQGYLCELCGHISSNRQRFLIHLKTHKKKIIPSNKYLQCSNCNKSFKTKFNLKEHENYCLGTLPFVCTNQYCDKKFPSSTKLKNHIKLKHDKKFLVICSICNIGFIKVSDYKSHMISHSTDKKYFCAECDKSYKTIGNLNFHMKVHNQKLPFSCRICEKGFMRKEYLEAHVNNHQGIKNFACTICNKKFSLQKNLDAHLKYHDGTVKKNKCNICGKLFSTGFDEHLRVHNNLREFECGHCDMKFNTKSSLAKHIKKKHSDACKNSNKEVMT